MYRDVRTLFCQARPIVNSEAFKMISIYLPYWFGKLRPDLVLAGLGCSGILDVSKNMNNFSNTIISRVSIHLQYIFFRTERGNLVPMACMKIPIGASDSFKKSIIVFNLKPG